MRHPELKLFAGACLLYNAGRWLTAGDMVTAVDNARWIVRAEETYLYRRVPQIYRPLRDTVLFTWLISIPFYAAFPVAPPRLAGLGITDSVSAHGAVALTGRSSIFYNELAAHSCA